MHIKWNMVYYINIIDKMLNSMRIVEKKGILIIESFDNYRLNRKSQILHPYRQLKRPRTTFITKF